MGVRRIVAQREFAETTALLGGCISGNLASTTFVNKAASVSAPARNAPKAVHLSNALVYTRTYGLKGGVDVLVKVQDASTNEAHPTAYPP
jgi:esterase/lipase